MHVILWVEENSIPMSRIRLRVVYQRVTQFSIVLALTCLLFTSIAFAQAEKSAGANSASVAGTWKMVSETSDGDSIAWTLTLAQADGHWTATVSTPDSQGAAPATQVSVTGNAVHFQTQYQGSPYDIDLKLAADSLTGTWSGEGGSGKTSGKRAS